MRHQVFCVLDKAVQAYLPPFFARSKGEALRSFSEACNDEKHQFHRHAADYTLVFLGEWEDASGIMECAEPARIISAMECLADDPFSPATKLESGQSSGRRLPM